MAIIRPQQMGQANFSDANRLRLAAQEQLGSGLNALQNALGQYRQNVVDQNTAQIVNAITGATSLSDLANRQQGIQSLLAQAGGDVNSDAIQKAQLAMPDTLQGRAINQTKLDAFNQQQHDQPILNQAMAAYASGDSKAASALLGSIQGDASSVIKFGTDRQDEAYRRQIQQEQLGIQRAGLSLRQQTAQARAAQSASGNKALQKALSEMLKIDNAASQADTQAAVKNQNDRLTQSINDSAINNGKNDATATAKAISDAAYLTFWPNAWQADRGKALLGSIDKLDPNRELSDKQRSNLLNIMNNAFETDSSGNPDKAASDAAKAAIDSLRSSEAQRLSNTRTQIQQKRATDLQRQRVLLQSLLESGNTQGVLSLLSQYQFDDEE